MSSVLSHSFYLDSYAMELKVFIDEAVYNVEISPRTRILQDYAMVT